MLEVCITLELDSDKFASESYGSKMPFRAIMLLHNALELALPKNITKWWNIIVGFPMARECHNVHVHMYIVYLLDCPGILHDLNKATLRPSGHAAIRNQFQI